MGAEQSVPPTVIPGRAPTEDELLFQRFSSLEERLRADSLRISDSWRVLRIMGEYVWGFDNLAEIRDGVSFFGSARTRPDDPHYVQAVDTARLLAHQGIPVLTGGGPGIMAGSNRGARDGGGISVGCNI